MDCWRLTTLLCLAGVCAGCARTGETQPTPSVTSRFPAFVGAGPAATCDARCVANAISIARAHLGLDPLDTQEGPDAGVRELFEPLRRRAEASGATIESLPVEQVLREMRPGASPRIVLVHDNGHLHVLLGALDIDGKLSCQLLHGDMPLSLVSKEQLSGAGFREAWRLSGAAKPVRIRVGSGSVEINELLHNFGEMLPTQTSECSFTLANRGERSIIIAKPTASCRCALLNVTANTELAPRQLVELTVRVHSINAASQRSAVWLKFFEKGTGATREAILELVASQRAGMHVTPDKLDFGFIVPGETHTRSVRIVEVPTDRFLLKNVELEGLPATHQLETTQTKDGLSSHLLRVSLSLPEDIAPGLRTGTLRVTTDSHVRPQIVIPVQFNVPPHITPVPSVVSFGTFPMGDGQERRVQFISRQKSAFAIVVETCPKDCSTRVEDKGGSPELVVTAVPRCPGVWQATIALRVRWGPREERIDVKCVGYVSKAI